MSDWRNTERRDAARAVIAHAEEAARRREQREAAEVLAAGLLKAAAEVRPAATGELVDPRELIGAQEVCAICGWKTRKSIGDYQAAHGFPEPVATVSGTRLWTRTQVQGWQATRT